jgi:hypothetical protein
MNRCNNDRKNQTADDATTLRDYIREINESSQGGFALTEDLDHWAGYGVLTRDQLGDYLDECVRQEDDGDDDFDYDRPEPTWDAVSRHDSNEGW